MFKKVVDQSFWLAAPRLTEANLPDQSGRVFIVTGGYTGVGYELSKILYQHHGTVYIAGRSQDKGEKALSELKKNVPESRGRLEFLLLDLADLTTVRQSAETFMSKEKRLDVLVNNAGVMVPPAGSKTTQGFELQIGTNCLGPFLFTGALLPILKSTAATSPPNFVRVIWAGSLAVDLMSPKNGVAFDQNGVPVVHNSQETNYGQSKAGNVLLAREMAARSKPEGIVSVAFNPGNLTTELQRHVSKVRKIIYDNMLLHPPIKGAYTELYAGWSDEITIENCSYIIPWGRIGKLREDVEAACSSGNDGEISVARNFWEWCEKETAKYAA